MIQEEGLRGGQNPVPCGQLLGGDVRACNAERDDLASQQAQNETPCPQAQEALPEAAEESFDRRIIDLWASNDLIACKGRSRLLGDRLFIVKIIGRRGQDGGHCCLLDIRRKQKEETPGSSRSRGDQEPSSHRNTEPLRSKSKNKKKTIRSLVRVNIDPYTVDTTTGTSLGALTPHWPHSLAPTLSLPHSLAQVSCI
jgi:hypothetical protein